MFQWDPSDPDTNIDVVATILPGAAHDRGVLASIPRADLDEFIAHIVSQAAEETLGRVLLFPCLRKEPKLETGKSKFVAGEICPFCNCLYSEHTETDDEIRCPPPKSAA